MLPTTMSCLQLPTLLAACVMLALGCVEKDRDFNLARKRMLHDQLTGPGELRAEPLFPSSLYLHGSKEFAEGTTTLPWDAAPKYILGEWAKRRGVDVRVLLDKTNEQERYSAATFLQNQGVAVLIDDKVAIAHNKVMVIDGSTVLTGSFNFTNAAESNNAENLLVIHDATLAAKYTENWQAHLSHSQRYLGR